MKTNSFLITVLLFVFSGFLSAQTFEVPKDAEFKTKDDYAKYEKDIVAATNWLETTDLDKETEKRKDVNAFVLQWVTGSPDVSIEINESLSKIYGDNSQLLALYLASYSKYYIEHKESFTNPAAIKAGLNSMMKVYKRGIEIKKSKEMEKILKMNDAELTAYINENLLNQKK